MVEPVALSRFPRVLSHLKAPVKAQNALKNNNKRKNNHLYDYLLFFPLKVSITCPYQQALPVSAPLLAQLGPHGLAHIECP